MLWGWGVWPTIDLGPDHPSIRARMLPTAGLM